MPFFQKKPVVIEAVQLSNHLFSANPLASAEAMMEAEEVLAVFSDLESRKWKWRGGKSPGLVIPTLEGEHLASPGDWIIKGVEGEFYPCKPSVFEKTYDPMIKKLP